MSPFSIRRRKATVPWVLVLWIFALTASIAHACGLGEPLEHAGMAKPASTSSYQAPDGASLPTCVQFCADDIPLLAKLKAVEDSPAASTPLLVASIPHKYSLASFGSASPVLTMDPPPGVAVNTRFVRLAL